jgi:hypothetical protein
MADGTDAERSSWQRWYTLATTFVAPATFVTALLFYFGYVSSRAQYRYFGLDVDTIGLSTQDFVMRSPQALLVPAVLLTLLAAAALVLSRLLDRRTWTPTATRRAYVVSGCVITLGLVMVFTYEWIGGWWAYGMVTPLVFVLGLLALAWLWHHSGGRGGAVALALLGVGICLFWATATLAQWTGLGVAQRAARSLGDLPAVVLDTKEPLYLTDGIVQETELPDREGQEYAFRYRGFRLLIQAGDRMFLVPERWSPSNSTVMVPVDDARLRFRFVNQPP